MAVNDNAQNLYDFASEVIGKKSGILLSKNDLIKISKNNQRLEVISRVCEVEPTCGLRIDPTEFESAISIIRKKIGNVPHDLMPNEYVIEILRPHVANKMQLYQLSMKVLNFIEHALFYKKILTKEEYNKEFKELILYGISFDEFQVVFKNYCEYSIYDTDHPENKNWDGVIPLSNLFGSEILPQDTDSYFDQRFINYLSQNESDLTTMHWRNFERLISEYFNRNGYTVELGPGSKDQGIDVKVWSDRKAKSGPPLIIIQCKRYESNKIGIETIKAFYADLDFEQAGKGLIATTSYISKDGKQLIKTRGYNIDLAEKDNVVKMIKDLTRYDKY